MRHFASFLSLLMVIASYGASSLHVERLLCENLEQPLGIDNVHPHFSWQTESEVTGARQTAYELQVKKGDRYETLRKDDQNGNNSVLTFTFDPLETDAVRFIFKKNAAPQYPNAAQLGEIEIYGEN